AMTRELDRFEDAQLSQADEPFTSVRSEGERAARTWHDAFAAGFSFSQVVAEAFFPLAAAAAANPTGDLSNYLLLSNDEPIATGTLLMDGAVAGIYNVATLPSARGHGFGSAMSTHILREARQRGATMAVLQSSVAGLGMYRRLGFEERFRFDQYVWRP